MADVTPLPDIAETEAVSEENLELDMTQAEQSLKETPRGPPRNLTGYRQRRTGLNWISARGRPQTPSAKRQRSRTNSASSADETLSPERDMLDWQDLMDSRIRAALEPVHLEKEEMKAELNELREENKRLNNKCIKLDSQSRKKNLKIWGIIEARKETKSDLKEQVLSLLAEYNINLNPRDLDSVFRIGTKEDNTTRCTLVHFLHMDDKIVTLSRGRHMFKDYGVRLDDDYPIEIEDNRRDLKPVMHAAKNMKDEAGKHKYSAKLNADRLIINGKPYTVNNTQRLPNELKPENLSTLQKDCITAFFTKHSPLSNHHKADQKIENTKYSSNEQFYMQQKHMYLGTQQQLKGL